MLNQVVLVGRIAKEITVTGKDGESKVGKVVIAVPRSYKNESGEYETDFIECVMWNGVAENTKEYCKTGDLIGIRGRVQIYNNAIQIIADKVTFLQSKRTSES